MFMRVNSFHRRIFAPWVWEGIRFVPRTNILPMFLRRSCLEQIFISGQNFVLVHGRIFAPYVWESVVRRRPRVCPTSGVYVPHECWSTNAKKGGTEYGFLELELLSIPQIQSRAPDQTGIFLGSYYTYQIDSYPGTWYIHTKYMRDMVSCVQLIQWTANDNDADNATCSGDDNHFVAEL